MWFSVQIPIKLQVALRRALLSNWVWSKFMKFLHLGSITYYLIEGI